MVLQAFALRDNTVMEEITLQARPRPLHCLGSSLTHMAEVCMGPKEPSTVKHEVDTCRTRRRPQEALPLLVELQTAHAWGCLELFME